MKEEQIKKLKKLMVSWQCQKGIEREKAMIALLAYLDGVLSGLSRRRQAEYSRACLLRLSRLVGVCYDSIVRWVLLLKGGS